MAVGPLARSLVFILEDKRELDTGRLAAHFDMHSSWHQPLGQEWPAGCYHILRLGHRLRFLCPPETPAEAAGSLLHILHRKMNRANFQRLRNRLFLKEAGIRCLGHARDEAIVATIAECLHNAGKNPFVRRGTRAVSFAIRQLRAHCAGSQWELPEAVAKESLDSLLAQNAHKDPHDLDPVVAETLRKRCERTWDGRAFNRDAWGHKRLRPLPLFKNEVQHSAATRSAWRDRLVDWLKTGDGKAWKEKRNARCNPNCPEGGDESVAFDLALDV